MPMSESGKFVVQPAKFAEECVAIWPRVWKWNPATQIFAWSDRLQAYGAEPDYPCRAHLEDFLRSVHPPDRAGLRSALADFTCRQEFRAEFRIAMEDGRNRGIALEGYAAEDESGSPIVVGVGADITRTYDLARQSEERSRLLETTLRSIGDGVITTDRSGRITFLNPIAEELSGWTIEEAAGAPSEEVFRIVNEETRIKVDSPIERVLREGIVVGLANHTVLLHKDGHETAIDDSGAPIIDHEGNILGAVLVFRDVSERRVAEEGLQRLAAIVRSSEDAIVSKDLAGIVTSWNGAAERIYGYPAEEMIGRSKARVIPLDMPNELSNILDKIRAGQRIEHYETVRVRKDGRRIDVAITVSPIHNSDGRVIGASTIARDITERKRLEELRDTHQSEVEALNQQLRRSMQETHHRVRNSLQLIAALTDMQMMDGKEMLPVSELKRIASQVQALAAVHDILTREAGTSGDAHDLSAREILERLVDLFQKAMPGREISTNLSDARITVKQGSSLAVIVNELLTNAVKHSDGPVELRFYREEPNAVLEVLDQGPGFPEQFDPDRTQRTGLTLIRHTARWDLGGSIEFGRGPNNQGGRVSLKIPLNGDPAP